MGTEVADRFFTYEVVGTERITIGGRRADAVHLHLTTTQGGPRSGGGTEERWVQPGTNLLLASWTTDKVESPSPIGRVTYEQTYRTKLRSLTPEG